MPSFEELADLANLVQPNKIKNLVLVGTTSNPDSKLDEFYHAIVHNNVANDDEAAALLYQTTPQLPAYYKLKERLYESLLTTSFFIDVNQPFFLDHQRAYHLCLRQLLAVKALLVRGARQAAIPLAKKGFKKAQKFEFTDIALAFAKHLRTHYGTIVGDKKNYNKYNNLVSHYLGLYSSELKAEEFYTELIINYVNSSETKQEVLGISEKYAKELKNLLKRHESYQLYFLSYLVFILRYQVANDYKNIIKVSNEAIQYFETKKHLVSKAAIFHYAFKMTSAYIQLKNYPKAEEMAKKCLDHVDEGISNWYTALDYNILVSFHSKKFQQAYYTYQKAVNHSSFSQQYKYISERWKTLEAFIYYLIIKGLVKPDEKSQLKKFRIKKFLNEVPNYSKDKRGNNITILILHVLFLLQQQKYDEIIDRVESLKTYTHRYLRQDDTFRSNCFIKMLLQLPAASFHKKGVIRKAKKYWDKLLSVPLEKSNQNADIEIIPYETLWAFVLDSLDNRFH
ncbi:MAG: hypothetical protein DHS20C13_31030 [Thermodesulfobacteriota bacterium]|nr:MAG: hypothetical protein DHS20C13_31030 [Thermodesulfobacteriota bacterium]